MLPTPGTTVTVSTEYFSPSIWGDYHYYEITGEVMAKPKWLRADEFAILNPNHPNGFSVINANHVVDIHDADGKEYKFTTSPDVKVWTVKGSKGNEYTVKLQNGEYSCECVGFQFRKHCKHITECI